MVAIPQVEKTTITEMDKKVVVSPLRPYLSMSNIGHSCTRAMWMSWRWCSDKVDDARGARILERGKLEEQRIIRDLKGVGVEVFRVEGNKEIEMFGLPDEPQEELIGFAGHAAGHPDGRVRGLIEAPKTVHLLEMKTAKADNFKKFEKDGLKVAFPAYYDQMIRYMGHMKLERGYFIMTNKDNEERKAERVYFSPERYDQLLERERNVIMSPYIPIAPFAPTWFECRYCMHRFSCHYEYYQKHGEEKLPNKNCRTCKFVDLSEGGKWSCSMQDDKELSTEEQRVGCGSYKLGIYPEKEET